MNYYRWHIYETYPSWITFWIPYRIEENGQVQFFKTTEDDQELLNLIQLLMSYLASFVQNSKPTTNTNIVALFRESQNFLDMIELSSKITRMHVVP